jgi:hypothetical protein
MCLEICVIHQPCLLQGKQMVHSPWPERSTRLSRPSGRGFAVGLTTFEETTLIEMSQLLVVSLDQAFTGNLLQVPNSWSQMESAEQALAFRSRAAIAETYGRTSEET